MGWKHDPVDAHNKSASLLIISELENEETEAKEDKRSAGGMGRARKLQGAITVMLFFRFRLSICLFARK